MLWFALGDNASLFEIACFVLKTGYTHTINRHNFQRQSDPSMCFTELFNKQCAYCLEKQFP